MAAININESIALPSLDVDAVKAVSSAIETDLLDAMRQLNGSESNSGSIVQSFPGGSVTAASLSLGSVDVTTGRATVAVPGSAAAVDIPLEVIKQFGQKVVVLLTSFDQGGVSAEGAVLESGPVGVRLFDGDLAERRSNFREALHVRVADDKSGGNATCAFWDDGRKRWNAEGLETIRAQDGSIWCATPHLTVFGAVLFEVSQVAHEAAHEAMLAVVCSNAEVFSLESLQRLLHGDWSEQPAAILLWSVLACLGALQGIACLWDRRTQKTGQWCEEQFFVCGEGKKGMSCCSQLSGAVFQKGLLETLDKGFEIKLADLESDDPSGPQHGHDGNGAVVRRRRSERLRGAIAARTHLLALGVVRYTVLAELARKTKVAKDDLKQQASAKSDQRVDSVDSVRSKLDLAVPGVFDGFFKKRCVCTHPWALFVAAHPFTQILSFSIFITKSMQSIQIASQLLGAAALSALFFSETGDALSIASSQECETTDNFWRSAAIGVISGLVTSIPMVFVAAAMKRHFVQREFWDEAAKQRQLRRWRFKDRCIWTFSFLYNVSCALFIATFLANIRPTDAQKWLESVFGILLDDFLLQPILVAVVYTLVSTMLVACSPGLIEEVRRDLSNEEIRMSDATSTQGSTTVPLSASIAAASWLLDMQTKRSLSVLTHYAMGAESCAEKNPSRSRPLSEISHLPEVTDSGDSLRVPELCLDVSDPEVFMDTPVSDTVPWTPYHERSGSIDHPPDSVARISTYASFV
jgi:hypothetical protein